MPVDNDILDATRVDPAIVPPGDYAMWLPSTDEPRFAPSETRRNIGRAYRESAGIETFALAAILRRLGLADEDAGRVGLPDDLATVPVLGPGGRVFVLSFSAEKGIRFHFHRSETPAYRNEILAGYVAQLELLRRAITLAVAPEDEPGDTPPAGWWALTEEVVERTEGRGEPVQAVGKIVLG